MMNKDLDILYRGLIKSKRFLSKREELKRYLLMLDGKLNIDKNFVMLNEKDLSDVNKLYRLKNNKQKNQIEERVIDQGIREPIVKEEKDEKQPNKSIKKIKHKSK